MGSLAVSLQGFFIGVWFAWKFRYRQLWQGRFHQNNSDDEDDYTQYPVESLSGIFWSLRCGCYCTSNISFKRSWIVYILFFCFLLSSLYKFFHHLRLSFLRLWRRPILGARLRGVLGFHLKLSEWPLFRSFIGDLSGFPVCSKAVKCIRMLHPGNIIFSNLFVDNDPVWIVLLRNDGGKIL